MGFGRRMSPAGDFDGDGVNDIVIGANPSQVSCSSVGDSVVIFSGAPATGTRYSGVSTHTDGMIGMVSDLNCGAFYGSRVASGDIDGDGFEDLIIADYNLDSAGGVSFMGIVDVFYGPIGLAETDADRDLRLYGVDNGSYCSIGLHVADHDGDGYDDIFIGCPRSTTIAGHLVLGGPTRRTGNVQWDGESTIQVSAASSLGDLGNSVWIGDDVNGDGINDLIMGAPSSAMAIAGGGAAIIYYGLGY